MKRHNTPSPGANKEKLSPGLTLDSASVWKKRDAAQPDQAAMSSAPASSSSSTPASGTWARYIDSRLKQFSCR